MPYKYKREPLSDHEFGRLNNAREAFDEKFVFRTFFEATSV